jgi:L-alanine-DL-glutamate epimerase-like enolase superfamily enzyme
VKIKHIRASAHTLPISYPLIEGTRGDRAFAVAEVETEDGQVGYGLAASFLTSAIPVILERDVLPAIQGLDARDLEAIHHRVEPVLSNRGLMTGVNLQACSCLDIALWDLIGKEANRSVAQLLGGFRDHAPVYWTYGFGIYDVDQLVELARRLVAEGNRCLKVLVATSKQGWRGDVERVRRVRDAVGDGIELAIDANEGFDLDQAMALCRALEDLDLAWFEDPLRNNDARDLAQLRRHTRIPLAMGQMDGHSARFRQLLEHDAIDILMPNSLFNGGVSETRRVAYLAQIFNRPLVDAGGGAVYDLHHIAGFANGRYVECHFGVESTDKVLYTNAPIAENGIMRVPDRPGFGLEFDRDVLNDSRVVTDA